MIGRWIRRLFTLVLLLVVAAALAAWVYTQRVLPATSGTLVLPGARAPLQILRDAHGIPTIRAASPRDAMYGLGVAHAQDRLWQMETHRRIGAGRLAEAFGGRRWTPTASCARWACAAWRAGAMGGRVTRLARGAAGLCRRRECGHAPS
jgi:hypothetical protein